MKTTTIIELKNGRPRLSEVSEKIMHLLVDDPSFYGEVVKLTGFGAEVKRPDGTIEQFSI